MHIPRLKMRLTSGIEYGKHLEWLLDFVSVTFLRRA